MVIPSAIGASQPGQSRVKPLLCSHQRGQGIHSNLPEREREKEGTKERMEVGGRRGGREGGGLSYIPFITGNFTVQTCDSVGNFMG